MGSLLLEKCSCFLALFFYLLAATPAWEAHHRRRFDIIFWDMGKIKKAAKRFYRPAAFLY
jgi:hypothetical protein